jgi:hypothetical protein
MNKIIIFIIIVVIIIIFFFSNNKSQFGDDTNKIAIVTVENRKDEYITLHNKSFKEYSDKHGYSYIFLNEYKNEVNVYWRKIYVVLELLKSGKYSHVMWVDSDTIIKYPNKKLEYYLDKYSKDIIIGVDCWKDCSKINIINTGVFVIKNSEIGISLLTESINEYSLNQKECVDSNNKLKGAWAGECYEQGVINKLILSENNKYKNKYKNNTYIDYSQDFICNYDYKGGKDYNNNETALIIHLSISSSNTRKEYFQKYI